MAFQINISKQSIITATLSPKLRLKANGVVFLSSSLAGHIMRNYKRVLIASIHLSNTLLTVEAKMLNRNAKS